jgi:predicted nuclease of restriction endonuclease-like (RecB) superfamily
MREAADQIWGNRQLKWKIGPLYFEGIMANQQPPLTEATTITALFRANDLIKDPYVLEFLAVDIPSYSDSELETAILTKLHHFYFK